MILTDWQIKQHINTGFIGISPYDSSLVNPASLDVRLGNCFTETKTRESIILGSRPGEKGKSYPVIDPTDKNSFYTESAEELEHFYLKPKSLILVSMLEHITLPANISVKLFGKSSLARLGVDNSSLGCWFDSGFSGNITLEIFNQSDFAIKLTPGMKIGQLVFFEHQNSENPYKGRYQNQGIGQGSLGV